MLIAINRQYVQSTRRPYAIDATLVISLAMHRNQAKMIYKERQKTQKNPRTKLPIHRPSILSQELLAGRFERVIRPQVLDRHGRPRQRVNTRFLDVLVNTDAVKAAS